MIDRVRFIVHEGEQILLIDVSNCSAAQVEKIFRIVPDLVTTRPHNSVLVLCDYTGASFDREATQVMKETAVFDKLHIKKSACVGEKNLPQGFAENLKSFSRREFSAFETREKALAWLTKD